MHTHSLLNKAPYNENIVGEWRYSSTHF